MNDTASAGGASGASLIPSTTDAFTAAHLAIVAIFAVLTIVAIVWGMRLKHRRRTAERDIAAHNQEIARTAERTPAADDVRARTEGPAVSEAVPPTAPPPPTPVVEEVSPTADLPVADPLRDEPIAASAPLDAAPAQEAASQAAPTRSGAADPLPTDPAPMDPAPADSTPTDPADAPVSTLKGLGPKLATRLGELGITTIGQVAALDEGRAAALDAQLGPFAGRMARDRWIEQARLLAAGDTAGFERVFGRL